MSAESQNSGARAMSIDEQRLGKHRPAATNSNERVVVRYQVVKHKISVSTSRITEDN
jgi:predicted metalloprotease with PDZ domain